MIRNRVLGPVVVGVMVCSVGVTTASAQLNTRVPFGGLIRGKNKVFALGPEVSLSLARNGVLYGFLKLNYQGELYARTAPQGSEFNLVATFPIKPIKLPTP